MAKLDEAVAALTDAVERQNRTLDRIDARAQREDDREALSRALSHRRPGPRRLTRATLLRAVPAVLEPFARGKQVPPNFWTRDGDSAIVACPCGAEPAVPLEGTVECAGEDCGRWFLFTGDHVHAANAEAIAAGTEPADPPPEPAE
jgi:hypothetical protein